MVNDIVMTKMPQNWQQHKKRRGNKGVILSTLENIQVGMAVEVSSYNVAKQYKSLLNKADDGKLFDYYSIDNKYYLGRIS